MPGTAFNKGAAISPPKAFGLFLIQATIRQRHGVPTLGFQSRIGAGQDRGLSGELC